MVVLDYDDDEEEKLLTFPFFIWTSKSAYHDHFHFAQTLAAIFASCNLPFLCMCLAMPESPSYLVSKGKVIIIIIVIILITVIIIITTTTIIIIIFIILKTCLTSCINHNQALVEKKAVKKADNIRFG